MCGGVHNIEMHLIIISLLRGMCFAGNHTLKLTSPLSNDSSRLKVCGSSREEGRLYRRGEKRWREERKEEGKERRKVEIEREMRGKGKCNDGRRESHGCKQYQWFVEGLADGGGFLQHHGQLE